MSHPPKPLVELEGTTLVTSALHAQLLERRRNTFEHDFKNLIHGLMSGTELLGRALANDSPRVTPAECVKLLQQQLGRTQEALQRLLEDIAPRATPPGPVRLSELIEECLRDVRHDLYRVDVSPAIPSDRCVHASRKLLKSALLYLLLDAADAAQRHAALELTTRLDGDTVLLELRYPLKDGAHQPPSIATLTDALRTENIQVDISMRDQVAQIALRLPLVPPVRSNGRVLIVDAHRDAADSLAMLAQLEGWETHTAYSIDNALDAIREHAPAALLIDVDGALDAAALSAQVREVISDPPRLIAMSHEQAAPHASFDTLLRKPLDMKRLRETLAD